MIRSFERRDFSTAPLGKLTKAIDASDPNPIIEFEFLVPTGSLPGTQGFILYLGEAIKDGAGNLIRDSFEIVFAVEKIANNQFRINRSIFPGIIPIQHEVGESVGTLTYGGVAADTMVQLRMLTLEPELRYLSELLQAIAGGPTTLLIPNLWDGYGEKLKVSPTTPASKAIKLTPGGLFARNDAQKLSKVFLVPPNEEFEGRTRLTVVFPELGTKQKALIYIDYEGSLAVHYGEATKTSDVEPQEVSISEAPKLFTPLAILYLDSVSSNQVIRGDQIQDLREWAQQ